MLLRPRPDGSGSAARIAGLLPPVRGGWLPPAAEDVDAPESEQEAPARSWSGGARHGAEPAWRLDPGRGGVVALLVVALVASVAAALVVLRGRPQEVPAPDAGLAVLEAAGTPLPGSSPPAATPEPAGEVVVSVSGLVRAPGLVRLPAGSRVDDAVRAAGGPVDPAAIALLNLARVLVDGEQVLVGVDPPPGAAAPSGAAGSAGTTSGGVLDLNAASASDLDALPGIGPVLAQRIVDWRTENGRFASVDQLREVTGIGEAKYEDLREKVGV